MDDFLIDEPETTEELITKEPDSVEFFYRRAKEEVFSLQMVEHILSGVERDQMKVIPKTFDDLAVKTALHKFGKVIETDNANEHSQAEFQLMQETENWYSALSLRDKNITVGHLRRFCETTRPALSSQALLALARFYRNAPYSESVRSKFDLIITRLLTKDTRNDRREMIFGRDEIIKHLEDLYAEWSSISLYSADKNDAALLLAALKFEDFMTEADEAEKFDDLIKKDFFNRLHTVKESTSESFFAPVVTTAAIECNVRVGNRYVELLKSEEVNPESLIGKQGALREQAISDVTGKTLELSLLLKNKETAISEKQNQQKDELAVKNESEPKMTEASKESKTSKKKETKTQKKSLFAVNKWLIIVAAIVLLGNITLYVVSNNAFNGEQNSVIVADKVNLENSILKEHLESARLSNSIFYGRVAPSWKTLSREEKERFLHKVAAAGKDRNFSTAHLLDENNKPVAFTGNDKIQINE